MPSSCCAARGIPVRERSPRRLPYRPDVPATGCLLQWLYAWRDRWPSRRAETDATLLAEIHAAPAASRGTYGASRMLS